MQEKLKTYIEKQARTVGIKANFLSGTERQDRIPSELEIIPQALAQLIGMNIFTPISLIRDLIKLTGGHQCDNRLDELLSQNGMQSLVNLRWRKDARIGLVAFLAHKLNITDWEPPQNSKPLEISFYLEKAMNGDKITPETPSPPMSLIGDAAKLIDEKLLSLLSILGEKAVAANPALPLMMLYKIPKIPALSEKQRKLLGLRVHFTDNFGQSSSLGMSARNGTVSGVEKGKIERNWQDMLPSQRILPPDIQLYRNFRYETMYRARNILEPPKFHPTVILMDIGPWIIEEIRTVIRFAAYAVAVSLQQKGIPVILTTTDCDKKGNCTVVDIKDISDTLEIWTQQVSKTSGDDISLQIANSLRMSLQGNSKFEPVILLLTHSWFCADQTFPKVQNLRALFVQYETKDQNKNYQKFPIIANKCQRWASLLTSQIACLPDILGDLIGK